MADMDFEDAAPQFPDPEPVDFKREDRADIADLMDGVYLDFVIARDEQENKHKIYDQMYRGDVSKFRNRTGPWEGAANLHVPMPYWLVDALQSRAVHTIWSQNPLVQSVWEEDDDEIIARDAASLVEWHLQPSRMNARAKWAEASKSRFIHGFSVSLMSYVRDTYNYRTMEETTEAFAEPNPLDDNGELIPVAETTPTIQMGTRYHGPVLHPIAWDDIIATPIDCSNLQPRSASNPTGADNVIIRQYLHLSDLVKRQDVFTELFEDDRDRQWWLDNAGDQTRVGAARRGGMNNERVRQQDAMDGIERSQAVSRRSHKRQNPEFEVLTCFGPYEHPETGEEEEMVFFVCRQPKVFLGAFLLSDILWTCKRPLLEHHFQRVPTRLWSMGVMEICEHLSEELDTIHNMRLDVGFATNLPWAFVRASAYIKPSQIRLKPMELVPVENPNDVRFPQVQNVTAFYQQEESLLLTIVERVMGITDLFLGINQQGGAAGRHATGFLGTKQEAEARMSEVLSQDAESFAFMCRTIYEMEMQYGPIERVFRLEGRDSRVSPKTLTRDDLWFRGTYDFRLGANVGMFSQHNRFQRAQTALQTLAQSPLVQQDMGRHWELMNEMLTAMGYTPSEVELFIGPKNAVSAGTPKPQDEENAQMAQGIAATVHPSDDDMKHIQELLTFLDGPEYEALGLPNVELYQMHMAQHQQAMMQKQQQRQMAMQPQQNGQAQPQNRAQSQIANVQPSGQSFSNIYQAQTQGPVQSPPNLQPTN